MFLYTIALICDLRNKFLILNELFVFTQNICYINNFFNNLKYFSVITKQPKKSVGANTVIHNMNNCQRIRISVF